jgi:adenylosuccinate lyase
MSKHEIYQNPLITRYASREMAGIFGEQNRIGAWRKLWIALAESEMELGLNISAEQIAELKANLEPIDFAKAADYERQFRHDVMAHVHTYADACPLAKPIIHLGATSCFVTDNGDLILIRDAMQLVANRLAGVISQLAKFSAAYRATPCLGFTHMQAAQPTTIGKRAALWNQDLVMDLQEIEYRLSQLRARSIKGTTGTQASFLELFAGDHDKVVALERSVAQKIGFDKTYSVSGQTYTRKVDAQLLDTLSGIAQSAHKMTTDLRLLAHRKEVEEPFEQEQIGSSAMPYKRNPMRSERVCALARFVISLQSSPANTFATQWMERTLDDSANRRLVIPQAFLAVDAILILLHNIADGLVVYENVIRKNLNEELPFMASENIMMDAVAHGGDRQVLHELVRQHSQAAGAQVKMHGKANDLMERLAGDPAFAKVNLQEHLDLSKYIGRAPQQVDQFHSEMVEPILKKYAEKVTPPELLRV